MYSVGSKGFRPYGEKQTKKTSKHTTKSKTKQKQKTGNRKNRVLAAVISALEIGALTFKVNMDPNESFMRSYLVNYFMDLLRTYELVDSELR